MLFLFTSTGSLMSLEVDRTLMNFFRLRFYIKVTTLISEEGFEEPISGILWGGCSDLSIFEAVDALNR